MEYQGFLWLMPMHDCVFQLRLQCGVVQCSTQDTQGSQSLKHQFANFKTWYFTKAINKVKQEPVVQLRECVKFGQGIS